MLSYSCHINPYSTNPRGCVCFGKNAFSAFASSVDVEGFVWQQMELRFSVCGSVWAAHFFILHRKKRYRWIRNVVKTVSTFHSIMLWIHARFFAYTADIAKFIPRNPKSRMPPPVKALFPAHPRKKPLYPGNISANNCCSTCSN